MDFDAFVDNIEFSDKSTLKGNLVRILISYFFNQYNHNSLTNFGYDLENYLKSYLNFPIKVENVNKNSKNTTVSGEIQISLHYGSLEEKNETLCFLIRLN